MPPTQLAIATSSLNRLIKEEKSYHKEAQGQEATIAKLEQGGSSDENAEYILRQERKALDQTKAMLPRVKKQIEEALEKLQQQLEQDKGPGDQSTPEEITKAKEAIAAAMTAIRESS